MTSSYPSFSVAMAIYCNDNPEYFEHAVRSIYSHQTCQPDEIIVVVDGFIPKQLEDTLLTLKAEIPIIKEIRFVENQGHAAVRQAGLNAATNNLVAIMDADDLSVPARFELQLSFFRDNPGVAAVGGQISEFVGTVDNVIGERFVPLEDLQIKRYLKARCPMNLVTVMYRKDAISNAGGFQNWHCEEDYYLWIRMAQAGMRFANLPETLVNVRVGKEMYRRRGGWKYFKSEAGLQKYMLKHGIIGWPRFAYNVAGRFAVQVAMPNSIRGFIFKKLFRR